MLQQTVIMPHVTFSCHAQGKINDVLGFIMNNYQKHFSGMVSLHCNCTLCEYSLAGSWSKLTNNYLEETLNK